MSANAEEQELKDRLSLIESMIAEGRQSTGSWGWVFVLWGVAYYVAMAWATWGKSHLAWPVTMVGTAVLTCVLASLQTHGHPETTIGRAISAVWTAAGISMFVLLLALGIQGLLEQQIFMGIVAAMLGTANATSSMILKWKLQFACTLVWWITSVVCVMGSGIQSTIALLVAIFLCQIVFGTYMMITEARRRRQVALHA
jgi:hypothetical protein